MLYQCQHQLFSRFCPQWRLSWALTIPTVVRFWCLHLLVCFLFAGFVVTLTSLWQLAIRTAQSLIAVLRPYLFGPVCMPDVTMGYVNILEVLVNLRKVQSIYSGLFPLLHLLGMLDQWSVLIFKLLGFFPEQYNWLLSSYCRPPVRFSLWQNVLWLNDASDSKCLNMSIGSAP